MFNPEKLLGGLISSGLSGRGNSLVPGGVALGLLGVAMEAVSQYVNSSQTPSSTPPPTRTALSMPDSFLCAAKGVAVGIFFQRKILTGLFGIYY
jgi:hypothetical protein